MVFKGKVLEMSGNRSENMGTLLGNIAGELINRVIRRSVLEHRRLLKREYISDSFGHRWFFCYV
jgi:hypothetical protein